MLRITKGSVAVTAAITLASTSALTIAFGAQEDPTGKDTHRLIACDALTGPEEQLACFDAVVEQTHATSGGRSPNSLRRQSASSRPANSTMSDKKRDSTTLDSHRSSPPPNPATTATRSGLLEAMEAPSVMESSNLYRREKDVRDDLSSMPLEATIVSVRVHHDGRFYVELDNGEIWRETHKTNMRTPEPGRSVEIYQDGPGGHRMRIEENPRVAWVKRSD